MSKSAATLKLARSLGLSSMQDISEGGRGAMMGQAMQLLMQARAMVRPADEDLKRYGVDRPGFESLLSEINNANAGNDPKDSLDLSSVKANPSRRAIGYGLAAGIPTAVLSHMLGGSALGSAGAGLVGGGIGAAIGGMSAGEKNKKLLATGKGLRDYGVLTSGDLSKAMPLLSDKVASEKKLASLFYKELPNPRPIMVNDQDGYNGMAALRTHEPRLLTSLFSNPYKDIENAMIDAEAQISNEGKRPGKLRIPDEHISNYLNQSLKKMYPSRYKDPDISDLSVNAAQFLMSENDPRNKSESEELRKRYSPMAAQRYSTPDDKAFMESLLRNLSDHRMRRDI